MKKVFLIGIGGTAMGNLAVELQRRGYQAAGSDGQVYPPMSTVLDEAGIPVASPDDLSVMEAYRGGVYIIGNSVSRGHPQVEWLMENPQEEKASFAGFLGDQVLARCRNLVIAGTHGKSTTTAAAAWLIRQKFPESGYFVGGVAHDLSVGLSWPQNGETYFVLEGDEYDTSFFDKRSKFVHYRPRVLVINNLEFDHADIFRDLEDVKRSFRQVISLVPSTGAILFNGDDDNLRELLPVSWTNCYSFGTGSENHFQIRFPDADDCSEFSLTNTSQTPDAESISVSHTLLGEYNARNLAGAILGVRLLTGEPFSGVGGRVDYTAFRGMGRRQEVLYADEKNVFMEDFAHHPTAIGQTVKALRKKYQDHEIMVIMEPRSNTLRRAVFQEDLVQALSDSHFVIIAPTYRSHLLDDKQQLNREKLVASLQSLSLEAMAANSFEEIIPVVKARLESSAQKRLLVVFSNGAVGGIVLKLKNMLIERGGLLPGEEKAFPPG